jgi:hypothetical protein
MPVNKMGKTADKTGMTKNWLKNRQVFAALPQTRKPKSNHDVGTP